LKSVQVTNGPAKVTNRDFSGLAIREGLILTVKPIRSKHA
jgi:hypothetical protein